MEDIRQIYETSSDYVLNPTFLKAVTGLFAVGGIVCYGYSVKLINDVRKMARQQKEGLERKI